MFFLQIKKVLHFYFTRKIPFYLNSVCLKKSFSVLNLKRVEKRGKTYLKPFLMERNYADFSDPSKYEDSLNRLLNGLKRKNAN